MVETKKKKILIVDSDEFLKNTYANRFRAENFEVQTASNGEGAWNLMEKGFIPDVLFAATAMPPSWAASNSRRKRKWTRVSPRSPLPSLPIKASSQRGQAPSGSG